MLTSNTFTSWSTAKSDESTTYRSTRSASASAPITRRVEYASIGLIPSGSSYQSRYERLSGRRLSWGQA